MTNIKFSIVIPAYNAENNIATTLKSIEEQNFNKDAIEVIVVDDGSIDKTSDVCKAMQEQYKYIRLIRKQNGGVSSARNVGIKSAKGAYIIFLDADDEYDANYISGIDNFIENNEKVDIYVTDIVYSNGTSHWRKTILKKSGIVSIDEYPNIVITTMNICVKNLYSKNELFRENIFIHEDEEYAQRVVKQKRKFGFVLEAIYKYNNETPTSTMNTRLNPYYSFDENYNTYLKMIVENTKNGKVDRYVQGVIINDLFWKLRSNVLFSINENIQIQQREKISILLDKIDSDIILSHPVADKYHKHYFISLKRNATPIIKFNGAKIMLKIDTSEEHVRDNQIVISDIVRDNDSVCIKGFFKNYLTTYCDKKDINIYASDGLQTYECKQRFTYFNYHRCKTLTNKFIGFDLKLKINNCRSIEFYVIIKQKLYKINKFYFTKYQSCNDRSDFIFKKDFCIEFSRESANFKILKQNSMDRFRSILKDALVNKKVFLVNCLAYFNFSKIWIYSDREGVIDNAFFQYLHDRNINDGVKRYYVGKYEDIQKYTDNKIYRKELITRKDFYYQLLYLKSEKIITSFVDPNFYRPISDKNYFKNYINKFKPEIVYLQHGSLHAKTLHYAEEFLDVSKVIVSTYGEIKLFKELGFNDSAIIKTGAPRYDKLTISKLRMTKINKILYMPSWRSYLAERQKDNTWVVTPDKFLSSNFGRGILDTFGVMKGGKFFHTQDLYVDIKLHPLLMGLKDVISVDGKRISLKDKVDICNYDLVITDYSSVVYDIVFSGKPVIYFCPDYEEYKSGLNLYCDTTVPIENGFGPLTINSEGLQSAILDIIKKPNKYFDRYERKFANTFLKFSNPCDKIYESIR